MSIAQSIAPCLVRDGMTRVRNAVTMPATARPAAATSKPLAPTINNTKPTTIAAVISKPAINPHLRRTWLGLAVSQPRCTATVWSPSLNVSNAGISW